MKNQTRWKRPSLSRSGRMSGGLSWLVPWVLTWMAAPLFASDSVAVRDLFELRPGTYESVAGNNSSICPQEVKVVTQEGVITALWITHTGDCVSQGPFAYYCDLKQICVWGGNEIRISGPQSYRWEVGGYGIWGEFELKDAGLVRMEERR